MVSKLEKVQGVAALVLGVEEQECTLNASIIDDLHADSLDCVELVMGIEEAFELSIPDDDADKFKSIGDIVAWLEKNHHA